MLSERQTKDGGAHLCGYRPALLALIKAFEDIHGPKLGSRILFFKALMPALDLTGLAGFAVAMPIVQACMAINFALREANWAPISSMSSFVAFALGNISECSSLT